MNTKTIIKSKMILTIIAAMLMVIMMVSFTGCGSENDNITPTVAPGNDYELTVSGPDTLKAGEKVEYTVEVSKCNFKEGLLGIDFSVKYNKELLKFESSEVVKVPTETWDVIHRADSDEQLTYFAVEDNDIIEDCVTVKGEGEFEVKLTFTVLKETSEDKNILSLFDVMGTKDNETLDVAYGTGNAIELK